MSDTPETDQQSFNAATIAVNMPLNNHQFCHASHARNLERERNKYKAALEKIAGWNAELFDDETPYEMRAIAENKLENKL